MLRRKARIGVFMMAFRVIEGPASQADSEPRRVRGEGGCESSGEGGGEVGVRSHSGPRCKRRRGAGRGAGPLVLLAVPVGSWTDVAW